MKGTSENVWGVRDHVNTDMGMSRENAYKLAEQLSCENPDIVYDVLEGKLVRHSYLGGETIFSSNQK